MGGGAGAGSFFGGLLGGVGQGLAVRRERQDKIKRTAFEGALKQISDLANDPSFSHDPAAIQDLSNASLAVIADYAGKGEVTGKGKPSLLHPKGKTERMDPLTDARQRIQQILGTTYLTHGTVGDPDSPEGVKPRKGPFLSEEDKVARKGKLDEQAAAIAQKIAVQKQAALAKQKRVDDQQYHEYRMKEGQSLGLTGIQLVEYADPDKRTLTAERAAPKETATDVAEQAYADTEGKPKKDLTAAEKIAAVRAARGTAKAPTKEEVAYAEKHGKKPEELTGSEKLLAVKEARETERLPQRPPLQSGTGGTGSEISDDELRSLAEKEILTNDKPSFGLGKSAVRDRYNKIMADVWASDPDSAEARAAYRAGTANLTQLTRLKGQVSSFETAFELDADNAQDAAKDVPRTSMRKFNSVAQLLKQNWTDDPALATLAVNVQTVVNQYARLVSSATGGGVSTDSARQEAMAVLDKSMASGSFGAAINRMKLEARNRITGLNKEIESAKTGMRRGGGGGSGSGGGGGGGGGQMPHPKTKTEFDALPSGTVYVDPKDNKQYRKP